MATKPEPAIPNNEQEFKRRAEEYHQALAEYFSQKSFVEDRRQELSQAQTRLLTIKDRLATLASGLNAFIVPFMVIGNAQPAPKEDKP